MDSQEKSFQSIKAEGGSVIQNVIQAQTINIQIDADVEQLRQQLTTAKERHWQEQYERLRVDANAGYIAVVQEPITQLIAEIEAYEANESAVNVELKAKIYRLAAIVYLPHQTDGDAEKCTNFLAKAQAIASEADQDHYQIIEALLTYERGDTKAALEILKNLATNEALRLRFSIHLETNQLDECRRLIERDTVDLSWSQTNPDWARVLLGYYTGIDSRVEAENALEILIDQAPTGSNYRLAAQSLTYFAYKEMQDFCLEHNVFPEFQLGIELGDLVETSALTQAASFFVRAAELYKQNGCREDAIQMFEASILLSLDDDINSEDLVARGNSLSELDGNNPLLIMMKAPGHNMNGPVADRPKLLELYPLLADPMTKPVQILRVAMAIADTPSRAQEVIKILEAEIDRFTTNDITTAKYVFTILQLWQLGHDSEQAIAWLAKSESLLVHPRHKPLFYVWYYWHQKDFKTAETWITQALEVSPQHPEVLALAAAVYDQLNQPQRQLIYNKNLFDILRTRQTVIWYLNALWRNRKFSSILEVLNSVIDLSLDEAELRFRRARALIGLNRGLEARQDLEWLRTNNFASAADLLNLAGAYHLLNDLDAAIAVLRDCIQKFPTEAKAYLQLSSTYLLTDRRNESFEWALKAYQEFPDKPEVLLHLWSVGFPTGQELHPEVRAAFGAFMPGGRFADKSPFISFSVEEFLDLIRPQWDAASGPDNLYHANHVSFMILCGLRNVPTFRAHREASASGAVRYIANGEQQEDLILLVEDQPRQVVLDYSALLTLWSLLDVAMMSFLARYFDSIWLPDQLRMILLEEYDRLAQFRQVALYEAKCAIRDAFNRQADNFSIHPRIDPPDGWDVLGHHTEITIAQRENLVHLDEHISPNEPTSDTPTIGLACLADVLYQAGEIDLPTTQAVKEHAKPPTQEETALESEIEQRREIVASLSTLVTWAMVCSLDPLLNYFDRLHISEPARDRLLGEISGYEFQQQTLESFQSLRQALRQGEEDGLLIFGTIAEAERLIAHQLEEWQNTGQPETDAVFDPVRQRLFDYLDELLGLAHRENLPIWTDDRWTKRVRFEQRQPRYSFGTDTFLAFAHQHPETTKSLSSEQYHAYYDKLVEWGYRFLPINVEHIIWHLQQGKDTQSKVLTRLLQHYCRSITGYLDWMHQAQSQEGEQIANQIVGYNNRQLVVVLHKLYDQEIDPKISADIFAALDLSRQAADRVLGREPLVLSLFLLDAVLSQPVGKANSSTVPAVSQQGPSYSLWLNQVILESGVKVELLEETWYQLAQYLFNLVDNAETDRNRLGALVLVERMLDAMPVQVMHYLLSTDMGSRLQKDFKLQIHERIQYNFVQKTGDEIKLHLPTQELQHDYDEALNRYLEDPSVTTISTDLITLKIRQVAPGSIFLAIEEIPTEIHHQHPDAQGFTGYICVLYGSTSSTVSHREFVWQIGSQALQRHHLSTSTWNALQERVLATDGSGIQTGLQLRRHLLSQTVITKEYFAQAAQLAPASIIQLLTFIEPSVIREWLAIPSLDWSSAEALTQWIKQTLSQRDEKQHQFEMISLLEQYGRSIFPDAPLIRQHILSGLEILPSRSEQRGLVEQWLSFAEAQSSLSLKANVVLVVYEWLYRHDEDSPQDQAIEQEVTHRLNSVLLQILQGWASDDPRQAAIATLEATICRWLYYIWSTVDLDEDKDLRELAYLAHIGASHIIDALATDGQISLEVTRSVINELNSNIRTGSIVSGIEPQPDGFFRPVWCLSLNYAASYLLKGLTSDDLLTPEFRSNEKIKAAVLRCGFEHRREQVFCSPILPEPSWLDAELAIDIGLASVAILGSLSEAEIESWSEQERNLYLFASAYEAILELLKTIIATLPDVDDNQQFMQHIQSLFQGQAQPSPKWYEILQDFFSEEVITKLRQFAECYDEVTWRLGQMVLHPGQSCPAELTASINDLLFEVPIGTNAADLLEIKADVLSQLVGFGLNIESVCQWLRQLAKDNTDDIPTVRLAFRPFILRWPYYSEEIGEPIYETLMEIAKQPEYQNLWEFGRLVRYKQTLNMHSQGDSL